MGLFSKKKKQKEFKTHSFTSRLDYIKTLRRAEKNMSKKQFASYQNKLTENLAMGQIAQKWRKEGKRVQINPQSPKLRKFVIG